MMKMSREKVGGGNIYIKFNINVCCRNIQFSLFWALFEDGFVQPIAYFQVAK